MRAPVRTRRFAKVLRRRMSLPEVLLWQELKKSAGGAAQFRKQHPFGAFVLDFCCARACMWRGCRRRACSTIRTRSPIGRRNWRRRGSQQPPKAPQSASLTAPLRAASRLGPPRFAIHPQRGWREAVEHLGAIDPPPLAGEVDLAAGERRRGLASHAITLLFAARVREQTWPQVGWGGPEVQAKLGPCVGQSTLRNISSEGARKC